MNKMMFVATLLLLTPLSHAANYEFKAGAGVFKIEEVEKIGIQTIHEYKFNGKSLGTSTLVGLEAELVGSHKGTDYILIKGGTGGSACSEVLSVVRVKNDYLVFSPQIDACGGILSVESNEKGVAIEVLERDERTKTGYAVIGSIVLVEGQRVMENEFSFLQ